MVGIRKIPYCDRGEKCRKTIHHRKTKNGGVYKAFRDTERRLIESLDGRIEFSNYSMSVTDEGDRVWSF